MGKTLKALMLGLALATAPIQKPEAQQFSLGLSAPCHGLLAIRGVYDFNEHIGIQADLGLFSGIDVRVRQGNFYGYAGILGIPPWTYALVNKTPEDADGPTCGIDVGVGVETNPRKKGFNFGIEGGLVLPIPGVSDTGAFRIDLNAMYKF